jgi:hypothetical protein
MADARNDALQSPQTRVAQGKRVAQSGAAKRALRLYVDEHFVYITPAAVRAGLISLVANLAAGQHSRDGILD